MKKQLLTAAILLSFGCIKAEQTGDLSNVANLLSSPKIINTADEYDIYQNKDNVIPSNYTLEVKAKVKDVDKRGMDVEVKNGQGVGFRMVTTPNSIFDAATTFGTSILQSSIDNTSLTTLRYVVENNNLKIFRNDQAISEAVTPVSLLQGINIVNENDACFNEGQFDSGVFGSWMDYGIGATVEIVDKPTTSPESEQPDNRCLHVSFPSKLNNVDVVAIPVMGLEPGATYELKYKLLPFLRNAPGGGYNITLGVYADPTNLTSLAANWHNGYAYAVGVETDPVWNNAAPLRFKMADDAEYVYIRIIARNNPCSIYFDDFSIVKIEYPTEFPVFKTIPEGEADDIEAKTGLYNPLNLFADRNPGFEYCLANGSPNVDSNTQALPVEENYWFSNNSLSGSGGARAFAVSGEEFEGKMAYLIRFESGYQYFSHKLPATVKPNTAYKASFDLIPSKAPSIGKRFYVNVSNTNSGVGGNILNSTVATIGEFKSDDPSTTDVNEQYREVTTPEVAFFTPNEIPEGGLFLNLRILDGGDILSYVDKFFLVEQAEEFTPKGQITIGKNFFTGAANMEIESIKYTDAAIYPGGSSISETNLSKSNVFYNSGLLTITNPNAKSVIVTDLTGKVIVSARFASNNTYLPVQLSQGVYIVKIDNQSEKLMVK